MAKYSESQLLERRIMRRFSEGIRRYGLVAEADRILVGVSGGKDSLALLEWMAHRARIYKPRFTVVAAHVAMANIPYHADVDYLHRFASDLGVEFISRTTAFDASTDHRKSPCFLCSWNRRKVLFEIAKECGCNKVALGHHMDDILVTLLMNLTFQGAFSAMPPLLAMDKFQLSIIRPFCLVHEADLAQWATLRGYHPQQRLCPYDHDSHRADMEALLHQLEQLNPEARYSLWGSMKNIQQEYLPSEIDVSPNK